ncbi:hypothetical protein B5E92_10035 [Erysipelatoclostridium sp. An15]|uniref:AAA family ATPase n=1 Tax=Erysipelatoclostridium sp. An15 TaxID=1965566 RepID=UPI000B385CE4|nr:ATP-binding protein [Erysipelatoclostridium sp. An15]OUQ07028.1 hypothetical protein B5E92_10035 [Erysipelatoclostridium sp. An15]
MKIKKIQLENNIYFGNATFDFTKNDGSIVDTIILAGENGSGKTQLLNLIYEFSTLPTGGIVSSEKRTFTVLLSTEELSLISSNMNNSTPIISPTGEFEIIQDFTTQPNYWGRIKVKYLSTDKGGDVSIKNIASSHLFASVNVKKLFKSVFSTVEINYNPQATSKITAQEIDQDIENSLRSSNNLGTEIQQLFIDIHTNDAIDLQSWVDEHEGIAPPADIKNVRINRFKRAFSTVFDNLNFYKIVTENNIKKAMFKKYNQEVDIISLSSGEKQIVFRGAFLLRNQQSIIGNTILIDEPEISLHPKWQTKIFDYYRKLFIDNNNNQTSQLFIATHSQYVLDSALADTDNTAIILMKRINNNVEMNTISAPLILPSVTAAELNYVAFDIVSNDYHIELYGYLQQKVALSLGKTFCSVKDCDTYITQQSQYVATLHKKISSHNTTIYSTLTTYIRNAIDHPDPSRTFTEDELRCSIELLIELCR